MPHRPDNFFKTAAPVISPDKARLEMLEEARHRDDWIYLAKQINEGKRLFSSSTQWESARIGLSAIDDPICQKAAAFCETEGKFLRRRTR